MAMCSSNSLVRESAVKPLRQEQLRVKASPLAGAPVPTTIALRFLSDHRDEITQQLRSDEQGAANAFVAGFLEKGRIIPCRSTMGVPIEHNAPAGQGALRSEVLELTADQPSAGEAWVSIAIDQPNLSQPTKTKP